MDDNFLAERAACGDENAFRILIERHRRTIYRIAYQITLHEEDTLDVCQCVYLKLSQRLNQFHPTGSFHGWLATLTTRTAIDFIRKSNRRECSTEAEQLESLLDLSDTRENPTPYDEFSDQSRIQQVQNAMRELSPQQRAIFILRFEEDLKPIEIAERLELPPGQVRAQLCRAMKTLRAVLEQRIYHESR